MTLRSTTCIRKKHEGIAKSGGIPKRIVLDFELKKEVNRQLAKIQDAPPAERERQRREIAEAHGLKIVEGKIQFPDVRGCAASNYLRRFLPCVSRLM